MTDHATESGLELVLDNRKLIIAFVLLIFVCGCFFVVGFVEGKRQGFQQGAQPVAEAKPKAVTGEPQAAAAGSSANREASKPMKPEEQPLDWYKSVNRPEGEPEKSLQPPASDPVSDKPESISSSPGVPPTKFKSEIIPANPGPVTYSVQVGAFRQKRELDTRARMLREKGYECRIEAPNSPDDLYLLKVGTFHSRAEAVAMQLRLRQSGFPCFIKTN
jgi:cell division protein FtsN